MNLFFGELKLAKGTKLNIEGLEALGAKRLAQLLLDAASSTPVIKRSLVTELAATGGPKQAAASIRKRLRTLAKSRTFVDWQNRGTLLDDLQTQVRLIDELVAVKDPGEAIDLLWEFAALANAIFERCDDSSGKIIGVFRSAVQLLSEIAVRATPKNTETLVLRTSHALLNNGYGQFDDIIGNLQAALGPAGLAELKASMKAVMAEPKEKIPEQERKVFGWSAQGALYEDDIRHSSRKRSAEMALRDIADSEGDADTFAASYDAKTRKMPGIAADIAERLLKAGRPEEALTALEAVDGDFDTSGHTDWLDYFQPDFSWEDSMIATLDALGRSKDAQDLRWQVFERHLSILHLRGYLKKLADFEDVEAEERALAFVENHEIAEMALWFLVKWPALNHAARLVLRYAGKWDGNGYESLSHAADVLSGRHPLAATILLRAMIDFTLQNARSTRYKHAARHLLECSSLASQIPDFQGQKNHENYLQSLQVVHSKKASFWDNVTP